jgi:plastocyanin
MVNSPQCRSLGGGAARLRASYDCPSPAATALMKTTHSIRASFAAIALLAALAACGGEPAPDTSDSLGASPQTSQAPGGTDQSPALAPGEGTIPGSPAPITGSIIEVQLIGDQRGYRFEPAQITARAGDAVKFVVISGGPHEISFDLDVVPEASRQQLQFNMPNSANARSPLLAAPQEAYTVSLGGLAPGTYPFVSTPRLPQGMKGEIRIQ